MTGQPLWTRAIEAQFGMLSDLAWLRRHGDPLKGVTDLHVQDWMARSTPFAWDEEVTRAVWRASQTVPAPSPGHVPALEMWEISLVLQAVSLEERQPGQSLTDLHNCPRAGRGSRVVRERVT